MDPQSRDAMRSAGKLGALGIELAGLVIGCLLAGWWLDGKLGTAPYLTLAGIFLGAFGGFMVVWRAIKTSEGEASKPGDEHRS
jgi:ATP synthase protein I